MPPLPDISQIMASSSPNAQAIYNGFKNPMYFELAIFIAALLVGFLVIKFRDGIMGLVHFVHNYNFKKRMDKLNDKL